MDIKKLKKYKDMPLTAIASDYGISLQAIGNKHRGLCIFHNDTKTPNLFIYPEDDSFFCYGCSTGGDKLAFIAYAEHISKKVIQALWESDVPFSETLSLALTSQTTNYLINFKILLANTFYKHKLNLDLHFLSKYDNILKQTTFLDYTRYSALVTRLILDIKETLK